MGRLKPGVTMKQAQSNMDSVTDNIAKAFPKSNKGWGALVEPLKNDFLPKERIQTLWMLLGAVGFVLLIACVNVANLLLAKGTARQKEIAIRSSLGASRRGIFAQFLTENLLLACLGGVLGVGVGAAVLRWLVASMPRGTLPSEADLSLNLPILLFSFAATTLAGLLFGCAPAWYATRVDPGEALKEGGRSGTGAGRQRLRKVLVIGEFALALALLTGAGLAIHSFWNLTRVDLGVNTVHVQTFCLPVPDARPKDPKLIIAYYQQMLTSIKSVPGVLDAAVSVGLPLEGPGFGMPFTIAGQPDVADPSQRPGAAFGMVTPDYFKTYGIQITRGRAFTDQDTANTVHVAMVNEQFVQKYLQGQRPAAAANQCRRTDPRRHQAGAIHSMADRGRLPQCARRWLPTGLPRDRDSVLADTLALRGHRRAHRGRPRNHDAKHRQRCACSRSADRPRGTAHAG